VHRSHPRPLHLNPGGGTIVWKIANGKGPVPFVENSIPTYNDCWKLVTFVQTFRSPL